MNEFDFNAVTAAAAAAAYWNNGGRTDASKMDAAYSAAHANGLTIGDMDALIGAALANRTGSREDYLAEARKIIAAA